jgi:hypothetical protein
MTSRGELSRRIGTVRALGRTPTHLTMSPQTWAGINQGEEGPLLFEDIPVRLDACALGVAIVFSSAIAPA